MKLHVLTRGQVTLAARALVGNLGKLPHLVRGKLASGYLGTDHLDAFLALSIYASAKAIGPEFIGSQSTCEELLSL
jgi:hypothetical protein